MPGFVISGLCAPAGAVAGDWYDYIPLPDGRWGLVLADVSGKGMPAALLMSATRGLVRSLAETSPAPELILGRLNEVLLRDFPSGKFVTMVYALMDPAARTMTFANAGHPWPLLANGNGPEFLKTDSGLPLGVAECAFEERQVELKPGSRVLFYTDGITEAEDLQNSEFGAQRLQEMIARPEICADTVVEEVRRFAGRHELADDATVILVKA